MKRLFARHLPLGLWTAACALFFGPILAGVARFPNGDFAGQFHAFALHQARELSSGRLPVWSGGSYAGFPFAADTQAAVFYPVRLVTIIFSLPWDFPYYALEVEAITHVWLAGVFTYFLALDITKNRWAGLFAAIAFGLGGYLTSYPPLQLAILETITWLPLVLLCLRRGIRNPSPLPTDHSQLSIRWLLLGAIVLGISALAGHPQTFLHIIYLSTAYFFFLTWRAGWHWTAQLRLVSVVALIVAGVSAVAWLPALRYLATTTRSEVSYDFVATGFSLLDYLQTVVPGTRTVWSPQYIGLAAFVFAMLAWIGRGEQRNLMGSSPLATAEVTFWAITAVIAAWLSLGDKGILFEAVYHLAPGFALFRQQERLAGLFTLSLALLAAQGLAWWLLAGKEQPAARQAARKVLTFSGGLLLLAGLVLAIGRPDTAAWVPVWWRQLLLLLLAGIAFAISGLLPEQRLPRFHPALRRGAFLGVICFLIVADLFLAGRASTNWPRQSPAVFWPHPPWIELLLAEKPGRVDSQNLFGTNWGEIYNLEDIRASVLLNRPFWPAMSSCRVRCAGDC